MLFQIYGDGASWQLLGWLLVFTGLVLANEFARRSKLGGIICFLGIPAVLTVYFIAIYVCAGMGMEWALNNQTYTHMNSWFHYAKLYAATAGCIGFMMLKYKWSIGKTEWFKVFPFVIVAINILIAVVSDFESGRLVENNNPGISCQPLSDNHLLLVSSRQALRIDLLRRKLYA